MKAVLSTVAMCAGIGAICSFVAYYDEIIVKATELLVRVAY